jgi:hypothetical protein
VSVPPKDSQMMDTNLDLSNYLGSDTKSLWNADKSLILCVRKEGGHLDFAVLTPEGQIVHKKERIIGEVRWHSVSQLWVKDLPRVLPDKSSDQTDFTRIIQLSLPH